MGAIAYSGGPQNTDFPQQINELNMDWDNVFGHGPVLAGEEAVSIPAGLFMSLSNRHEVDIEYISEVTGKDMKTVISALWGVIYQNPQKWDEVYYKGFETADEYLSGNIRSKLDVAIKANKKYPGYFNENVRALREVLPARVPSDKIYVTPGSPWLPADIVDAFIKHIMKASPYYSRFWRTKHDEVSGTWQITNKSICKSFITATENYGTKRKPFLYLLEDMLNMKTIVATREESSSSSKSGIRRVVDKQETLLEQEKEELIRTEFSAWVWKEESRKLRLVEVYDNLYGCIKIRHFNGSFLNFPGMSPSVKLYPYQKNAVARILFSPNTLLAHDVGAGKTYVMIAAGMEKIRLGLASKCIYVVPNNITQQWTSIFREMYPDAKLLCVEPKIFTPSKKQNTLESIRDGNYEAVIMAYSCFESIPVSSTYRIRRLREERSKLIDSSRNRAKNTSILSSDIKRLDKTIAKESEQIDDPSKIYFDELGFDAMFVDEAHNFKNLPIRTKISHVLGVSSEGSARCCDMLEKIRYMQRNDGGGVVFATGTPITNSISDVYVMQYYLQPGELSIMDLANFEAWVGMFAERHTDFEIDVDTNSYRLATRFSRFHNLPELTSLLASIADFHQAGEAADIPQFDGYEDVMVNRTREFEEYLERISKRADDVRNRRVSRDKDNMLKITTDGRKAALDWRLVMPGPLTVYESKVVKCAGNVADIYFDSMEEKLTQVVFCDTSTPKKGFNLYDELKRILILYHVPEEQIAFIHDANTARKREKLFKDVREGRIRILVGSTFKLGIGVNIQDRLVAVHHLDVPWRPCDIVQREGRMLRPGNKNKKGRIFRYITRGSFDAYSWQLLETKQQFIADLLSGSMEQRNGNDIEDSVLNYAEVKALAVGNPLVKERVETANELTRLRTLQRRGIESIEDLRFELSLLPEKIEMMTKDVDKCRLDMVHAKSAARIGTKAERDDFRKALFSAVMGNELELNDRFYAEHRGFRIILPANMTKDKPYIYLEREGRYRVELGGTEKGDLVRIDNFIDDFEGHYTENKRELSALKERQTAIKHEIANPVDYSARISACMEKLKKIDKELEVI